MKILFIKDGLVLSHATFYDTGISAIASHPDAEEVNVPDDMSVDSNWLAKKDETGQWIFTQPPQALRMSLSRVEFKMRFSQAERLKIKSARAYAGKDTAALANKALLDDFYEIIDDPSLVSVPLGDPMIIEGVTSLADAGFLTAERAKLILAGVPE